jgi:branched-chain amino acid transport system ATP-binding protein
MARQRGWQGVAMLEIRSLQAGYDGVTVVQGVDLDVGAGEIVALLGANGAGKTTLNKAVSGLLRGTRGRVMFEGRSLLDTAAAQIVAAGLIHVSEGRKVFPNLHVRDNLVLGSYRRARASRRANLERVFDIFPRLAERATQPAGTLSGGEQQMLAIGRALMAEPRLLILDEPSLGLAPKLVDEMLALVRRIATEGLSVLLVEQNVVQSLQIAQRAYVMENGRITMAGQAAALLCDPQLAKAYLGM